MTEKDMIYEVLKVCGCSNTFQIKGMIYRKYGEIFSQGSISGQLRALVAQGVASKSSDGNNKMVYWITDWGKENYKKGQK